MQVGAIAKTPVAVTATRRAPAKANSNLK